MEILKKMNMMFGGNKESSNPQILEEEKIEKARKRKDKDPQLKRAYDSFLGKIDSKGMDMQEKFLEFLAKNPISEPVYRPETEEFEIRDYKGMN